MPDVGLAVLESRWWKNGNDSVRPLFETLFGILEGNPHSFRYDMFTEDSSLRNIISDITENSHVHSIYIASHGSDECIVGLKDHNTISRSVIRNSIKLANSDSNISGLYFGSCGFCSKENANFILNPDGGANLKWVAGYTNTIDWIDSSAIDMIFWSKYLTEISDNKKRKKNKKTPLQMVNSAADKMKKLLPTAFDQLGFNIYYLDSGNSTERVW